MDCPGSNHKSIDVAQELRVLIATDVLSEGQNLQDPLRQAALDSLNRQLRSGIKDEDLAELVSTWYREERLCLIEELDVTQEPQIVYSLGLF